MRDWTSEVTDAAARLDVGALARVLVDLRAAARAAGATTEEAACAELLGLLEGRRASAPVADAILAQQPELADLTVPARVHERLRAGDLHGASALLAPWLERQRVPVLQLLGALTQALILMRAGQPADAWRSADWARRIAVAARDPDQYAVAVDTLASIAAAQGRDGVVLALFERAANALDLLAGAQAGDRYRARRHALLQEWGPERARAAAREQWALHRGDAIPR